MKKILLTIITIITVLGISGISSAKDSDEMARKRKHAEMLREAKAKKQAADKKVNINKSKSDKAAGKVGIKTETGKTAAAKGKVGAKETITAGGKEHQQQIMAFDKQLAHEKAKYLRNIARLKRIRELAVQKGNTEMVERVDKLMKKAQQINSEKKIRIQEKKLNILQLSKQARPGVNTPKAPGKGLSNKAKVSYKKTVEAGVKSRDVKVKEKPISPDMKRNSPKDKPKAPK